MRLFCTFRPVRHDVQDSEAAAGDGHGAEVRPEPPSQMLGILIALDLESAIDARLCIALVSKVVALQSHGVAFVQNARQNWVDLGRVVVLVIVVDNILPVGVDGELLAVNKGQFINSWLVVAPFLLEPRQLLGHRNGIGIEVNEDEPAEELDTTTRQAEFLTIEPGYIVAMACKAQ